MSDTARQSMYNQYEAIGNSQSTDVNVMVKRSPSNTARETLRCRVLFSRPTYETVFYCDVLVCVVRTYGALV